MTSYGKGKCEFSARVSWKAACRSLWMQNFHTHYSKPNLLRRPFWDQWQQFLLFIFCSYWGCHSKSCAELLLHGSGNRGGSLAWEEQPISHEATAVKPRKRREVNQGQQTKTLRYAPITAASVDQVLIQTFTHQHCRLNVPLPDANPLSSPMVDTPSLKQFWRKKQPFHFFVLTIAFSSAFCSHGEMCLSRRTVKLNYLSHLLLRANKDDARAIAYWIGNLGSPNVYLNNPREQRPGVEVYWFPQKSAHVQ